jgi:hypothetical protein
MFSSDRRGGSMHGKLFVLEVIYAGIDEEHLYTRLDFASDLPPGDSTLTLHIALREGDQSVANYRLDAELTDGQISGWKLCKHGASLLASPSTPSGVEIAIGKVLEIKLPMVLLGAEQGQTFNLRFVLYRDHLPIDALPQEGSLEVQIAPEDVLVEIAYESQ